MDGSDPGKNRLEAREILESKRGFLDTVEELARRAGDEEMLASVIERRRGLAEAHRALSLLETELATFGLERQ